MRVSPCFRNPWDHTADQAFTALVYDRGSDKGYSPGSGGVHFISTRLICLLTPRTSGSSIIALSLDRMTPHTRLRCRSWRMDVNHTCSEIALWILVFRRHTLFDNKCSLGFRTCRTSFTCLLGWRWSVVGGLVDVG